MRRLVLLSVLALGVAGCGGSGASNTLEIQFGISGGNIAGWSVTISPSGRVTAINKVLLQPNQLSSAQAAQLSKDVRAAMPSLEDAQCGGTFPDEADQFIEADGKKWTVRGTCEASFTNLFNELATAVGAS